MSTLQISVDPLVPELINGDLSHFNSAFGSLAALLDESRISETPFHLHVSTIKSCTQICTLLFEFILDSNASRPDLLKFIQPAIRKMDLLGAHVTICSLGAGKFQVHIETNVTAKCPSSTMSLPSWLHGRPTLLLNRIYEKSPRNTANALELSGARLINAEWSGDKTIKSLIQRYVDGSFNMVCFVDLSDYHTSHEEAQHVITRLCNSGLMSSPADLMILVSKSTYDKLPKQLLNIAGHKILKTPLTTHRLINPKSTLMQSNMLRMSQQTSQQNRELNVLLIDDCDLTRRLVKTYFNENGFGIVESATAKDAIKLTQQQRFDAVLLDLDLPDMTGFELAKMIKTESTNIESPIIAITASKDITDYQKCFEYGMADCVVKPLYFNDLMNRIRGWMPQNSNDNNVILV